MNEPDITLLARDDLPDAVFPGGRNAAFRVYFAPEVHDALWKHAGEDTSVEICGVLVGTWHRDEAGPFAKVVGSIRGEGAETKFAEVTFTHQTWAKINAEMDTKFADLKIVGWYHTHPDFGIFLSDRDRFIQEHFFSGPGQVAHVIDPLRRTEGVFIWRDGKPALADHFWVGDRILTASDAEKAGGRQGMAGLPASPRPGDAGETPASLLPPPGRLIMYLGAFVVGYALASASWWFEHQSYIQAEVARNGVAPVLRLGLSDELDALRRDVAALGPSLDAAEARSAKAEAAFAEVRRQLALVARRAEILRATYGNSPAVEDYLRRLVLERYATAPDRRPDRGPSNPPEPKETAAPKAASPPPPAAGPAGSGKS